jgi:predicted Kef-type K+ transport protein
MLDPIIIIVALLSGMAMKHVNYPPMLGFLLAGFIVSALGLDGGELIKAIADAGVTMLLFTIGLKLKLKDLGAVQVWGVAGLHMVLTVGLFAGLLFLLSPLISSYYDLSSEAVWTVAFALSFSSTVFAVKIFEERGDGASIHAQIAIGILIMQDLAAVVYLAMSTGKIPHESALLLFLLIPLRPLLERLLDWSGHGELLLLFGIGLAFGGSALFEAFSVKGDLGALLLGVLLAKSSKANELSKSLMGLKDLFLVGFFVSVGLVGFPETSMVVLALVLASFAVIKLLLFFVLLTATRLRARTSLFCSLSLYNYSEFGLIVAALAVSNGVLSPDWLVIIALALAFSFFISVPANRQGREFYNRHSWLWHRFESQERLASEQSVDLGKADVVVLGMGRVGGGVYEYLNKNQGHRTVVAVEERPDKARILEHRGVNVVLGDASDPDFWENVSFQQLSLIMVSLTNHSENMDVVKLLKSMGYQGHIAVIARFPDEQKELMEMGCIAFNLYAEAGHGFAEHVFDMIDPELNAYRTF